MSSTRAHHRPIVIFSDVDQCITDVFGPTDLIWPSQPPAVGRGLTTYLAGEPNRPASNGSEPSTVTASQATWDADREAGQIVAFCPQPEGCSAGHGEDQPLLAVIAADNHVWVTPDGRGRLHLPGGRYEPAQLLANIHPADRGGFEFALAHIDDPLCEPDPFALSFRIAGENELWDYLDVVIYPGEEPGTPALVYADPDSGVHRSTYRQLFADVSTVLNGAGCASERVRTALELIQPELGGLGLSVHLYDPVGTTTRSPYAQAGDVSGDPSETFSIGLAVGGQTVGKLTIHGQAAAPTASEFHFLRRICPAFAFALSRRADYDVIDLLRQISHVANTTASEVDAAAALIDILHASGDLAGVCVYRANDGMLTPLASSLADTTVAFDPSAHPPAASAFATKRATDGPHPVSPAGPESRAIYVPLFGDGPLGMLFVLTTAQKPLGRAGMQLLEAVGTQFSAVLQRHYVRQAQVAHAARAFASARARSFELRSASHDLRNQTAALSGLVDLLSCEHAPVAEVLDQLGSVCGRLGQIASHLGDSAERTVVPTDHPGSF